MDRSIDHVRSALSNPTITYHGDSEKQHVKDTKHNLWIIDWPKRDNFYYDSDFLTHISALS